MRGGTSQASKHFLSPWSHHGLLAHDVPSMLVSVAVRRVGIFDVYQKATGLFGETVDKAADSNIALTRWYRKRLKLDVEAASVPAIAHGLQPDREPLGVAVLVARTYLRAASYRIPRSIGPFGR